MSYHDRKLISASKAALRGVKEITFTPSIPSFQFGSIRNDWRAVGDDMRKSMKQVDLAK
jgi:hypothetical protein